jgi:hypothetical protein
MKSPIVPETAGAALFSLADKKFARPEIFQIERESSVDGPRLKLRDRGAYGQLAALADREEAPISAASFLPSMRQSESSEEN